MDSNYTAKNLGPESDFDVDDVADLAEESSGFSSSSVESESAADAMLSEEPRSDRKLSVIGRSLVFKGDLSAAEDLLIQGRVQGTIKHTATNLTIGSHGEVKADIDAQRVIVQGGVQGDIRGVEAVTIEPSARVNGNIYAPRIGLKEGAKFKGSIDMDPDAAAKAAEKAAAKAAEQAAAKASEQAAAKAAAEQAAGKAAGQTAEKAPEKPAAKSAGSRASGKSSAKRRDSKKGEELSDSSVDDLLD